MKPSYSNPDASARPSVQPVYHDYSNEKSPSSRDKPEREGKNLPILLHHMLSQVEMDNLSHIVSWQPHGRCFIVHRHEDFVNLVLPM